MPPDVQFEAVNSSHLEFYEEFMSLDERPRVNKEQELFTNRIIWFNEIDEFHTFNHRSFANCSANMMLVGHRERG
jgi:hypothetical protein